MCAQARLVNAGKDAKACASRASAYSQWCGNKADRTTATFLATGATSSFPR